MQKRVRILLSPGKEKPVGIRIIQIEISTVCDSSCIYCPLTIYREQINKKFMNIDLFKKIVNESKELDVEYLHLQGWGEPLLHPNFFEMLRLAHAYYKTGFTTNGKWLTPEKSRQILQIGIDLVAITFAGASATTHNKIRVGNEFDLILHNLREFIKIAKTFNVKPRIIAIYMMLKESIEELPKFVELMAEIGVEEIRLSNLSYIPHPFLWDLKVFSKMFTEPSSRLVNILAKAKEVAREKGVILSHRLFSPIEYPECPENPTSAIFINVEGDVSPCVYLNIPAKTPIRCFEEKCEKLPKVVFGNLNYEKLSEILKKKAYKEFVKIWEERKRTEIILPYPPEACKKCYRLYRV